MQHLRGLQPRAEVRWACRVGRSRATHFTRQDVTSRARLVIPLNNSRLDIFRQHTVAAPYRGFLIVGKSEPHWLFSSVALQFTWSWSRYACLKAYLPRTKPCSILIYAVANHYCTVSRSHFFFLNHIENARTNYKTHKLISNASVSFTILPQQKVVVVAEQSFPQSIRT